MLVFTYTRTLPDDIVPNLTAMCQTVLSDEDKATIEKKLPPNMPDEQKVVRRLQLRLSHLIDLFLMAKENKAANEKRPSAALRDDVFRETG